MAKRKESSASSQPSASFQDLENGEMLRTAVEWAVQEKVFSEVTFHGNVSWRPLDLIMLVVVWVWSGHSTLTGAFSEAHHWSIKVLKTVAVRTYQGMIKALTSWTAELLPPMMDRLHELMRSHGKGHWRRGKWLPLAVDGSRISVPRTQENESAFCAPNWGRSATARYRRKKRHGGKPKRSKVQPVKPQIWLTMLWHMGMHMPWGWKSGPSYSNEREHFRAMLDDGKFPENTLFCADAGFTGYELWKAMIDAGHSFLIRVGGNVKLLRKLGYVRERPGIVYFWPDKIARKHSPPIVLRLIRLRVGRCEMWLVTNVTNEDDLSDAEAAELYRLRWGVELQFRNVKQTFGRRKLRSRTPDRALVELDWSLVGLWMIQLFAVKEQIAIGEAPGQCSVSLAIQIIRTMMHRWSQAAEQGFAETLRGATKDRYERTRPKAARYRPPKSEKDRPSAGKPVICNASREQKARLKSYLGSVA
jgi:Transposase DDE domain